MRAVRSAVRAELLDLEAIGIVTTVLLGDVVAVLALLARQGDLGADVCGGGHGNAYFRCKARWKRARVLRR